MKISGSTTPIQPLQSQTTSDSKSSQSGEPDASARFGSPQGLHPQGPSIGASGEILAKFRDPGSLTDRADRRRDGASQLKQQVTKQFGADVAGKIFNQTFAGGSASPLPHGGDDAHSFKMEV